ncbi:MAG TPA: type II secretion system F family protein [Candidatus Saccharibacteria bacterium]|nr:type II secretion system F family protein [Candidatus Saccharibacteria bacterium]
MLTYRYTAREPITGKKVNSEISADSEQAAIKAIQKDGLAPINVTVKDVNSNYIGRFRNRIKTKDKVLFSRQLSTLINAGLPLVQSLRNVAGQTQNKNLQNVINIVITDVESGKSFSDALARHPVVFDSIFINLVAAGEASGTLDKALERIANQKEKDAEIISKVRGAMVYPIIVLLVMVAVVIFMIVSVLPGVEEEYSGIPGAQLPLVTKVLLFVAHFTIKYWWIELIIIGVAIFVTSRWARSFGGKRAIDRMKMRVWPIGRLFMKLYMARFTRVGSTLVASGVPLIQMLDITGKSVNNIYIQESLQKAVEKVKGGVALSTALKGDENFLELVPDMLRIGEQSGSVEQMLSKTADYYEREVDNEIKAISTTIEPVLMIVMGIVAITIVTAILLPVYSLVGKDLL